MKKIVWLIRIFGIILCLLCVVGTVTAFQAKRKSESEQKLNAFTQSVSFLFDKMDFIQTLASENEQVSNMSILSTEEMQELPFLQENAVLVDMRNYNAILGFSCEVLLMFDNSRYAFGADGKISYEDLEYCFDATGTSFSIYSSKENVYGNLHYVRNMGAGAAISALVYQASNRLNYHDIRYIFILDNEYLTDYISGYINAKNVCVLYSDNVIYLGENYKEANAIRQMQTPFVYAYSQSFPWVRVGFIGLFEIVFFVLLVIYFSLCVRNYYQNIYSYIKRINVLSGKNFSDIEEAGVAKHFEKILLDLSREDFQTKLDFSDEFYRLLSEYIDVSIVSGIEISDKIGIGLDRLGVDFNRRYFVEYSDSRTEIPYSEGISLSKAVVYFGVEEERVTENKRCGKSRVYSGFSHLSRAYKEAKLSYEIALFYDKPMLSYHETDKAVSELFFDIEKMTDKLIRSILELDRDALREIFNTLRELYKHSYIMPETLTDLFNRLNDALDKIEFDDSKKIEEKDQSTFGSIRGEIEKLQRRSDTLMKKISLKNNDRQHYYFTIIKEYVDEHYTEEELSLNLLAEHFNYSVTYISRIFSEFGETNYVDYVNQKRVERAKELLLRTDWSVRKIAESCGVSNLVTFRRIFKKYAGKLPTEYREMEK